MWHRGLNQVHLSPGDRLACCHMVLAEERTMTKLRKCLNSLLPLCWHIEKGNHLWKGFLAVFHAVSGFSGQDLRRTSHTSRPNLCPRFALPPIAAGPSPAQWKGGAGSQTRLWLAGSSILHTHTAFMLCDHGPGFGIGLGKAVTWRASYTLSLPFRLFLGHLGSTDQEGPGPYVADSACSCIRAAQEAASPLPCLYAQEGSRSSFAPLDATNTRQWEVGGGLWPNESPQQGKGQTRHLSGVGRGWGLHWDGWGSISKVVCKELTSLTGLQEESCHAQSIPFKWHVSALWQVPKEYGLKVI